MNYAPHTDSTPRSSSISAMDALLAALRAVAEPTRLRLLALLASGEWTVSEIVQVLGQSQPRVSRHLRLLTEAGLLERFREGTWVFYRLARDGHGASVATRLADLLPAAADGDMARDRERLATVKAEREREAAEYFRRNAKAWDRLRTLHVDDAEVERTLQRLLPEPDLGDLLDLGTGTGRMLEVLGKRARRAEGIDQSHEMLTIARTHLERAGLAHCAVRHGDIYRLPYGGPTFDLVIVHQVLHFLDQPDRAIAEAARVLRAGGRLVIVDFAPHGLENLRAEHAHRRLGFADREIVALCREARLKVAEVIHLAGQSLTVAIWIATKPRQE